MIITIDGPVASGKSTVSRILAHNLGYYYLSSGLLYRALSYLLVHVCRYVLETLDQVTQKDIDYCFDCTRFLYCYDDQHKERIFFDDKDITPYLKDRFIDKIASIVSVNIQVRHAVTQLQHTIAFHHNVVIEGRDVGSVVFPQAECKFFITASVEVRAQRWLKDQERYGNHFSIQDAIIAITERDERDKNRTIAPLIVPKNAVIIDTSDLSVKQTVDKIMDIVKNYAQSAL